MPADMSEREKVIDSEDDTEKRGREEQKPPNEFKSLVKNMNNSISTLRPEAKDNKVIKISGRKDEKETVSNDPEKEYIRKLPKTMTVDLSRKGILVLGTEVTLDANGENEGSEANMDRIPEIVEYCDDDTEDMLGEKTTAGGTSNLNIMTTLEVESKDSKAGGRGNEKGENAIISRPDNHEIDGIISNNEIASTIGITNEDNGNEVDGNEEKLEEKSFVSLVAKHWKDETKSHPNNTIRKDRGDDGNMKLASTDTYDTDSTGHEQVENDLARKMKENTHSEENIIKTHTYSNYLKNSKSKAGTIGSKIKFLWSPDSKETMCLVQGTVCKKLSSSYSSWKETRSRNMVTVKELIILHHWGEDHLEELPESLIVDLRQKRDLGLMRNSMGKY